jgi:Uncharacterized relative of glutathione S-transferase, MAPEG superfamily
MIEHKNPSTTSTDNVANSSPLARESQSVNVDATEAAEVDMFLDTQINDREGLLSQNSLPKFQPGDHVIRWKMIKAILWPIQIHGIVLSTDVSEDGTCTVVIADFGFSSTDDGKKRKGLFGINDMMRNFYDKKEGNGPTISSCNVNDEETKDKYEKEDGKRFHLRTISDPNDLKKWNKVNYGQSLFSSAGQFDKLKNLFKLPQKKKDGEDTVASNGDVVSAIDDGEDFLGPISEGEKNDDGNKPLAAIKKVFGTNDSGYSSISRSESDVVQGSTSFNEQDQLKENNSLEELIAQANEVERRTRPRYWRGLSKGSSNVADDASVSSFASSKSVASNRSIRPIQSMNNLFKKISFAKKTAPDEYDAIPDSLEQKNKNRNAPKLPKSDPRTIVLARVKFILAEQEKAENESSLPKYHILYSNSECLAVWCKTGKFSTLQAAVFLHSTAVGNAKSSIMLGAGVAATQPWLIPVVGVYAIAAVGMPYYVLNQCKNKWRESEMNLTASFWETANVEVYVSAVENWSGLTPEKQEDSDEVGMKVANEMPLEEEQHEIVQV